MLGVSPGVYHTGPGVCFQPRNHLHLLHWGSHTGSAGHEPTASLWDGAEQSTEDAQPAGPDLS